MGRVPEYMTVVQDAELPAAYQLGLLTEGLHCIDAFIDSDGDGGWDEEGP